MSANVEGQHLLLATPYELKRDGGARRTDSNDAGSTETFCGGSGEESDRSGTKHHHVRARLELGHLGDGVDTDRHRLQLNRRGI